MRARARVRACVFVCVCNLHIVMLEPLSMSTLCVSFFLNCWEAFSVPMYTMCVILCLFSALSRRVGALQLSIIINLTSR